MKGITFDQARALVIKYGGVVRPFEKGPAPKHETLSYGVTDLHNMVVQIPGTDAFQKYQRRFFHDILLEREAEIAKETT